MSFQPNIVPNSSKRGFIVPGTGAPFSWDNPPLGYDEGFWAAQPASGQALDNFMQQVVSGITQIDQTLVRPRWQQEPPTLPSLEDNWAAIGVTRSIPLGTPEIVEVAAGAVTNTGFSRQNDQEEFDLLCSFYGPQADGNAVTLRSGFMMAQNRECLQIASIGLINTSGRTRVPTLIKQQYLMRVDITVTFRREVRQFYPVLYFLTAPINLITDPTLKR